MRALDRTHQGPFVAHNGHSAKKSAETLTARGCLLRRVIALLRAPCRGSFKQDACVNGEGLSFSLLSSKLDILAVDRGGPEYSTSYRKAFPHSFAPARIGGGLGGGWTLACEGSNPSPSA